MAGPALDHLTLVGQTLGHYRIVEEIGAGGMGAVYRAYDTHLDRDVGIKVLPPGTLIDESARKRFRKEALCLSKLNDPNIATIHDFDSQGDVDYLVMEYVPGKTLRDRISEGPLPEDETIQLAIQLAKGLAAAHEQGLVHRDLKPENVRLTLDGQPKILDFGLAKLIRPIADCTTESTITTVAGTLPYMSPEQVRAKELDARTDLFSFGAVLYEMATGKVPFQGESSGVVCSEILTKNPQPPSQLNPGVSAELEGIIHRALEKDRELRYQHAADMRADLQRLKRDSDSHRSADVARAAPTTKRRLRWLAATAILLVATLVAGYFVSRRPAKLTDKDTIVLGDFDNKTGDAVFDDTLKQGLSVQLEQSPFLDLVSERKVNTTLKLMGRPAGDRITPEVTREVCQRIGSKVMLTGAIAELGNQYVIGLKAVNCDTGDLLAEAQEQAAGKEAVLKALDRGAVSLRSKLGESLSSVQKYATPLEQATTPSLEALKVYSLGKKTHFAKGDTAALPFYKRAVELDSNFAIAYGVMAAVYTNLSEVERAAENARKAYELRGKVSERERFVIEGYYYLNVTGELEKAAQVYELWTQTYPSRDLPYANLGFISGILGNWEKALEEAREAMHLNPNRGVNYANLGNDYASLNRLDEAEAVYKQAEERKLEGENLLLNRYALAFLKGDAAQMAQLVSAAMGKPGMEGALLAAQADTEAWHGKLKDARELTRRAMNSAQHNDAKETAAAYQAAAVLREVESGSLEQARAGAVAAVRLAPNRYVRAMAALALARLGKTAGAENVAAELDRTFPVDTLVQRYWLPAIRAAVALQRKDPSRAIEVLRVASTIELGQPTQVNLFLCPVYLRGEAYLMLHDGTAAAAEFRKFIDHYGLVANFPWGALARLGLARAYALDADKNPAARAKARAAYQDFLTLWKDADPDIPILQQAKAEYARLQ